MRDLEGAFCGFIQSMQVNVRQFLHSNLLPRLVSTKFVNYTCNQGSEMDISNTVEASFSCKIWVLPAMNKMTLVFWDVTPYSLVPTEVASSSRNLLAILGFTTYEHWSSIFSNCLHPIDMLKQSDQIAPNTLFVGLQFTLFISPRHRSIATQLVEEQKELSL